MKTKKMDLLKAKAKSRLEERKLNRVRTRAAGSTSALPPPLTKPKPTPTPPPPPKPPPKPKRKNSRLPSPLTPEFKTARSTGNLVGTPKFETKSGRKKKRHRKIVVVEEDIVPYEITHGMKLSKLNFRLREKKKDHGYCWVSSVRDIAGVSDNDWLVEVNHQSTKGMGVKDVIAILRKTSKPFTLGFYRNKKK